MTALRGRSRRDLQPSRPWTRPIRMPPGSAAPRSGATRVTATPVAALSATLDRDDPAPGAGTTLPPLWHWLYFLPLARQSEIGPDGHPRRGGFLPPVPLPRRMWAGGRLCVPAAAAGRRRGDADVARSPSVASKAGALRAARLRHRASTRSRRRRGVALREEHDIVYRDAAGAGRDARSRPPRRPTRPSRARSRPTTCCCSAIRR